MAITKTVAAGSGEAITSAVDAAIGDAFAASGGGAPIVAGPNGLFLRFAADPEREAEAIGATDALAYAGDISKAPPLASPFAPRAATRVERLGRYSRHRLRCHRRERHLGHQVNLTLGVDRILTPDLLLGLFTGYENLDFS